ncbi:MAG: hypothetical protein AB9922_06085 [Bacteroidales bacterium]
MSKINFDISNDFKLWFIKNVNFYINWSLSVLLLNNDSGTL